VKVGGGFLTMEEFLDQYYDIEAEKLTKTSKFLVIFIHKNSKILCKI